MERLGFDTADYYFRRRRDKNREERFTAVEDPYPVWAGPAYLKPVDWESYYQRKLREVVTPAQEVTIFSPSETEDVAAADK